MTGMLELGAFIGCLFLPYLADCISHKWSLTVATFFSCVGAIIQTAANNYGTLVAGRLRDRAAQPARISLCKLRRVPATDERVQAEWKGILSEVRFQDAIVKLEHPTGNAFKAEMLQWADLFRPKYLRHTAIALGIPFFQQFSGINAFVYYAPTFFAALGQSSEMALILSGIVDICQLVAGIPTFLYLDSFGRWKLAIAGGIAMVIPHLIMAGVVAKFQGKWDQNQAMGWFGTSTSSATPSHTVRSHGLFLFPGPETSKKSLEQISELFGDNMIVEEEQIRRRIDREVWTDPKYQVTAGAVPAGCM
ncbi:hypothetical protein QQZ08_004021 [Neonectria magnoliae]|uniref:Major facilitator superfamily (MFS) profile domain-containing protein n=1 Tax=Neonectria magnoliae TaxID=2732573 RepID=A0ABR1I748_9HYPO